MTVASGRFKVPSLNSFWIDQLKYVEVRRFLNKYVEVRRFLSIAHHRKGGPLARIEVANMKKGNSVIENVKFRVEHRLAPQCLCC